MKKIIVLIVLLFVVGCGSNDGSNSKKIDKAFISSNGKIFITIEYTDDKDLDTQYEIFGEAITDFSDEVERRIVLIRLLDIFKNQQSD